MSYRYFVGYRPHRPYAMPFSQAADAVVGFVARAVRAARSRARENSAISILSDLDDRTLRDIGIPRSEIRPIAHKMSENPEIDYRVMWRH